MKELTYTFDQIEVAYNQKINDLKKVRKSFIIAILISSVYLSVRGIRVSKRYDFTQYEIFAIIIGIIILLLVPVIFAPLYTFFNDKLHNKFNWDVKMSIFNSVLDDYKFEYKVSFKNQLSDADIEDLEFENTIISFVHGDDLIFGNANEFKFRIAEMHSSTIIKRKFDGLVGVVIFDEIDKCQKRYNEISSKNIKNIDIMNIKNKIYFLKRGQKEYFEFSFKGGKLNKEKLISDCNDFKILTEAMFK
jgi:hypothetical protein